MTLSLSPRFDLFKFKLPKDFLADQVTEKYQIILNETPGVITKPIDYLNESIQGISFPRSEEHTSETPVTPRHHVCRLLLEKKLSNNQPNLTSIATRKK